MEAMSHSIPVIATDCGGINELVNLESGILIKMGDPDETFNAIYSLIKNPEKLTTIGKKGRNKIMEDFDTHKISTQLSREFFK
jgi:glycosyltransferase involved in cell wall biosynthesis